MAAGGLSLTTQPRAIAIAIVVAVVRRPPAKANTHEASVEPVIMKLVLAPILAAPVIVVPIGPTLPTTISHVGTIPAVAAIPIETGNASGVDSTVVPSVAVHSVNASAA